MDKNDLHSLLKLPLPVALALLGSWVRSASDNVKGRKRTAALLASGFCGLVLIPISSVLGISHEWLLIIAACTGWVGGDVVLNSISKQALKKLGGSDDAASE